jgi:hypothetical protein
VGGGGAVPGYVQPADSLEEYGYGEDPTAGGKKDVVTTSSVYTSPVCPSADMGLTENLTTDAPRHRSFASATRIREAISAGRAPTSPSVRAADLLDYYRTAELPSVAPGSLTPVMELRPLKIAGTDIPLRYELFVSVEAGAVSPRPPTALTVLVDTTPSMAGEPLVRAKAALRAVADALLPGDHLTVTTTADQTLIDDALTDPPSQTQGLEDQLDIGLDTKLRGPIETALIKAQTTAKNIGQDGVWHRVVVVSDGQGDPTSLPSDPIAAAVASGVRLVSVGVGGSYVMGDRLLHEASRLGHGSYVYIDTLEEPKHTLGGRFDEVFGAAHEDVRFTLKLPWFLKVIEEGTLTSTGDAPPGAIPPGARLLRVYQVVSCGKDAMLKYGASSLVGLDLHWKSSLDGSLVDTQHSYVPKDLLYGSSVGLDQVFAAEAFAAALRAPTATRFADAQAALTPLVQPGNGFEEMAALLDAYPKKP